MVLMPGTPAGSLARHHCIMGSYVEHAARTGCAHATSYLEVYSRVCRARDHPAVISPQPGQPPLRFYAGAPLVASNGYRLGSL